MDEKALIAAARQGDAQAFNQLVLEYQSLAYNVAFRILGDADAAADATQDAFLGAFEAIRGLRGEAFKPWLLRIVTNASYDQLRRLQRRPTVSYDEPEVEEDHLLQLRDPGESPGERVERKELSELLQEGILSLPAQMRAVLVLCDVQGLKYTEVAAVTGLELGTVKSRLSRARAQLRDYLLEKRDQLPAPYRLRSREPEREDSPQAGAMAGSLRVAGRRGEAAPSSAARVRPAGGDGFLL